MGGLLNKPIKVKDTTHNGNQRLKWAASSMQGWRTTMEDAQATEMSLPKHEDLAFFGVYDGHGGHIVSQWVAANLVRVVMAEPTFAEGNFKVALRRGFLQADREIFESPDDTLANNTSGCTCVVTLLDFAKMKLYVANAGDSRSVLCRDGEAVALSDDHKPDKETERDRIEAAGCSVAMGRVNGSLALSRAIGDRSFKMNLQIAPEAQAVTADPDLVEFDITPKDEFIIMACDGIWDVMTNQEAVNFVREGIAKKLPLTRLCEEMMEHCCADSPTMRGLGCDNMTVIIIQFRNNGEANDSDLERDAPPPPPPAQRNLPNSSDED